MPHIRFEIQALHVIVCIQSIHLGTAGYRLTAVGAERGSGYIEYAEHR
jgi:hypothetical protein